MTFARRIRWNTQRLLDEWMPFVLSFAIFSLLIWLAMEAVHTSSTLEKLSSVSDTKSIQRLLKAMEHFIGITSIGISVFGVGFFILIAHQFRLRRRYNKIIQILREGHERYKFLAEGPLSIGIMRLDCLTGKIVDANTGALRLFGLSRGQMVGVKLFQFLTEDSSLKMERAFEKLRGGSKFFEVSATIKTALGETREIDFHMAVLGMDLNHQFEMTSGRREAIAILTDVTQRRMAEEERLKNERLRGVLEMAGGAAHELNQPLQVILGYAALINMGLEQNHPLKEKAEKLKEEAEKLSEIGKKIASISDYAVRDYVGNVKIVDIRRASKKKRA